MSKIIVRIVVTEIDRGQNLEETMDKVEKIAREVFGPDGILPMESGTVEIIPDVKGWLPPSRITPLVSVFLYQEEDRTAALLIRILEEFEKVGGVALVNDQPENLYRTI